MNIKQSVSNGWSKTKDKWNGLDKQAKILIGGGAGVVAIGLGVGLGMSGGGGAPATAKPSPSPSAHPTPAPSHAAQANPLSGVGTGGHVLAVKVDAVGAARSQWQGLKQADVLYAIQVEGGLGRYMAVYDSNHAPATVGPVRSARQTDIPLLGPYGKVGLAYSGAISGLLPDLAKANLVTITPSSGLFSNSGSSPTFIHPAQVYQAYPNLALAKDVGFRFGNALSGGVTNSGTTVHFPSASFTWYWTGSNWFVAQDGRGVTNSANVIVQFTSVVKGKYTDFNAGHPDNEAFTQTTGHGSANFYRNGMLYKGSWSKPTDTSPTTYSFSNKLMTLAPGQTFVVLLGAGNVP